MMRLAARSALYTIYGAITGAAIGMYVGYTTGRK